MIHLVLETGEVETMGSRADNSGAMPTRRVEQITGLPFSFEHPSHKLLRVIPSAASAYCMMPVSRAVNSSKGRCIMRWQLGWPRLAKNVGEFQYSPTSCLTFSVRSTSMTSNGEVSRRIARVWSAQSRPRTRVAWCNNSPEARAY